MQANTQIHTERRILLAVYATEAAARRALERLLERDFPLDRVSILGRRHAAGDDPIGVLHASTAERVRDWAGMGAFWGGLAGLLGSAAGAVVLPGLGGIVALGPIAEALLGAAAGAGIGTGIMAGGAAMTELTQRIHRMGIPSDRLTQIQRSLQAGHYLLLLITDNDEADAWRRELAWSRADPLWDFPYAGIIDRLTETQ